MKKLFIVLSIFTAIAQAETTKYRIIQPKNSTSFICQDYVEVQNGIKGSFCTDEKTKIKYSKIVLNGSYLIEIVNIK